MRRAVVTFLIFLLLGVAAAVVFHGERGTVLIAFGDLRIQTSLAFAVITLIVALWLTLVFVRVVSGGITLPVRLGRRWSTRREARQNAILADGLGRFAEQRWQAAETRLKRVDGVGAVRGIARLVAACAASAQRRFEARDQYLADARFTQSLSELGVELTATELAVRAGEFDVARDRLARLNAIAPHHPRILALYVDELTRAEHYAELRRLLPDVEKNADLGAERYAELARAAWLNVLTENASHGESLISTWAQVPTKLKNDPTLVTGYVERLQTAGADHEAEQFIRERLNNAWWPRLAIRYGQLAGDETEKRLRAVERWLTKHGDKPELLLLAGRLCLRAQLWGRARHYLDKICADAPRADVLLELGSLYEQLGETDNARAAYRDGLARQVRE